MYYPWQTTQWQQIISAKKAGRLPHAILLTGTAGLGKADFADSLVKTLLCASEKEIYCGECHACRLVAGRVHPNILWIEPEKAGAAIKVDQVRELSEFVSQSSLKGNRRFVIIHPADDMNINAANALLKTLEEPATGAMLILVSNEAQRMPATILSRCQRFVFSRPDASIALQWMNQQRKIDDAELLLRLSNGAPLAALQLAENEDILILRNTLFKTLLNIKKTDPIKAAAAQLDYDLLMFVDHMLSWFKDLVQLQLNISPDELINIDYKQQLDALKSCISLENSNEILTYLHQLRKQVAHGFNLNKQLTIENTFIRWYNCCQAQEVACF